LALLENEVLELHRRLADAEQRAAVAERIAAEEIAAKKAKTALGNKLAQAAQTEKAENEALSRQVAELKDELGALKGTKTAAPSTSTPPPQTGKKTPATPDKEQLPPAIAQSDPIAPVPSDEAELATALTPVGDQSEAHSESMPFAPASVTPGRHSNSRLIMIIAIVAAISGWSLVIFDTSNSANHIATPPETPQPTAEAATNAPPKIAKAVPPPAPEQTPVPEVTAAQASPAPADSEMQTRSLQNERIEASLEAVKRAKQQRAELWRRLKILRKRLTETNAKLVEAEQQTELARQQTELANAALDRTVNENRRKLDANARASFRTEAKLMAEIKALRKALDDAKRSAPPLTLETE
jgi:hypothetical protein